jgi:ankyrin repeat protein
MFSNIGVDLSDEETKVNGKKNNSAASTERPNSKNRPLYVKTNGPRGLGSDKKTTPHKSTAESRLHKAISEGLHSVVNSVIKKDESLMNSHDENGLFPLHIAAQFNRVQIVNTLLAFGANCDIFSIPDGVTPLHVACR